MIEFRLSVDVLGNTRFAFSPLAEVGSSLRLLTDPRPGHLHAPWRRQTQARLARSRLDRDLLLAIAPASRWAAAFLFPRVFSPGTTIDAQLKSLACLSAEALRDDLARVWERQSLPARLVRLLAADAPAELLAEAIDSYWQLAIAPHWPRMCAVLEDDVSHRAAIALTGGLFDMLADLHPEVRLQAHTLSIDKPFHADAAYEGAVLTLVPSVFVWPRLILTHAHPGTFDLTYAARGVGRVWETADQERSADHLALLLGRTRACILAMVNVPMSTTQLARLLGQSPGSVNRHLTVLRDSGMVSSWRSGRSMLYRQTALGVSVVAVNQAEVVSRADVAG